MVSVENCSATVTKTAVPQIDTWGLLQKQVSPIIITVTEC